MAVTVEELEIRLGVNAADAQAVLNQVNAAVDAAVRNLGRIGGNGGGGGGRGGGGGNNRQRQQRQEMLFYERLTRSMGRARQITDRMFSDLDAEGAMENFGHYTQDIERFQQRLADAMQHAQLTLARMNDRPDTAISRAIEDMGTLDRHAESVARHIESWGDFLKNTDFDGILAEPMRNAFGETEEDVNARLAAIAERNRAEQQSEYAPYEQPTDKYWYPQDMARMRAETTASMERTAAPIVNLDKLINGNPYEKLNEQMKAAIANAEALGEKLKSAVGRNADAGTISRLAGQYIRADAAAQKLVNTRDKMEEQASKDAAADGIKKTGDEADKASKKVESYNRALSKGRKGASVFGKIFSNFGKSFHKNHGFLSKFGQTLKRVLTRMIAMRIVRGILNSVSEGMKILANSSDEAKAQLGRFTALGNAVKAQIGAAALAALNAMAGVLYNIASAAITAANAVANFFATLGGGTYFAVELAGSFDDIKESASGAGGAAKGMLAAFDELNVIGNKGGGGGGGAGLDGVATLAEKIGNSKLADLLLGEKWEEAGNYVAQQLNGILTNIDSFFNRVQNGGYGTKFARFLNGIFANKEMFAKLGKTVGDGVNAIVQTLYDFVTTFDAVSAADSLAGALNTAISTIDWQLLGRTAWGIIESALEFCFTFLSTFDFAELTDGLFEVISGAVQELIENPDRLGSLFNNLMVTLINLAVGPIVGTLTGLMNIAADALEDAFPEMAAKIRGGADTISREWKNFLAESRGDTEESFSAMEDSVTHFSSSLTGHGGNMGKFSTEVNGVTDSVNDLGAAINSLPSERKTKIVTEYQTIGNAVSSVISGVIEKSTKAKNPTFVVPHFASGGIVRGETIARLAEYPGARTNPEVISPLSDLQNILANVGGGRDTARQNELLSEQNRLLRAILDKPLEVKPSIGLGEVTTKSQIMYNRT